MKATQDWIATYSDYIKQYVKDVWDYFPGEHHFVAMYILPRLVRWSPRFGLPFYVNPDGTKGQPGDLIYITTTEDDDGRPVRLPRLAIEIKHVKRTGSQLGITRMEYNLWISNAREKHQKYRGEPHLFIAVTRQGLVLLEWERFRCMYLEMAYPKGSPDEIESKRIDDDGTEKEVRDAQPFNTNVLQWGRTSKRNGVFVFDWGKRKSNEKAFVTALEQACERVWKSTAES